MQSIKLARGRYIIAVSGGVDSMALLDLLVKQAKSLQLRAKSLTSLQLVVAHFDHGIRPDSHLDVHLVKDAAAKYGLQFESQKGELGPNASEATARRARYEFLEAVRQKYKANAIITAHHQDDLIETALLNIIRGTKRKGLSAIAANARIVRPLLRTSKKEILDYARQHCLKWRDDPTNLDTKILRNYLRLKVIPKMTTSQRIELLNNIDNVAKINRTVDRQIATLSQSVVKNDQIDRQRFSSLPQEINQELVAYWLRQGGIAQADKQMISRLTVFLKTGKPGAVSPVKGATKMKLSKGYAQFV